MVAVQGPFLAAVLLLVSSGPGSSSLLPACPESCTCQRTPLLNCSSSGLSSVPLHVQDSVSELDLSHNFLDSVTLDRPHQNLRNVWLGNNSITHLSLCVERGLGSRSVRGRHLDRLRPWSRRGCVSWAPTLQLLSVERNQLEQLPKGLEGSESLHVLQLSFNRISTLRPGDLSRLPLLKELHLQHNLITSLHPQMFQDLAQLRVLDLSFNKLTSLHPSMYLSLRNIEVDVRLGGNRWQCDCSMRSLRRRMAYDSSRGLKAWSVVCVSPSILSGRDLLQLEEDDLNCFSTENSQEFHQDVTVYRGSEILLSCSSQDSTWWTPSGPASVSQPQASLLISDITERDSGLYVCVSEEQEVVSVFNLQISKIEGARRKTRSLPRTSRQIISGDTLNRVGQERNQRASQSNLALAVCLSVFITFLIAFILGVLARPCIDVLWRRVMNKKSSSAANSVSSVEQRQYDNEAFSNGEEPQETGTYRERRVTFSTIDIREESNVQYYDTVASGDQESINNNAVIECEAAEAEKDTHRAGDSGSENSLRQSSPKDNRKKGGDLSGIANAGPTHNTEFEHIPDTVMVEKERSLSSCSDSSLSDKELNEDQMTRGDHTRPRSPQLAEYSIQQRADFSTVGSGEIPEFSSEPFADWSPHINNTHPTDPDLWQENEEQFEFSDSVRSTSARSSSVFGSFNGPKRIVAPTSDKQERGDMSSSSSYISEDEPTIYIVNHEEDEEDIERNHNKPEVNNASFEQQIHSVDLIRPSVGFNQGDYRYETDHDPDTRWPALDLEHIPCIKRRLDIKAPSRPDSSSSSDSEDEISYIKKQEQGKTHMSKPPITVSQTKSHDLQTRWPAIDLEHSVSIKRRLDIKTPSLAFDSSSSSDSEDETTHRTEGPGKVDIAGPPFRKSQPVTKDPDSSSSSDSEDETSYIKKQEQGKTHMSKPPITVSQTKSHDLQTRWPAIDLEHTVSIKRRLDIKTPSLAFDSSSSSDSEDETTHRTEGPGKVDTAGPPFQKSHPVTRDPDSSSSSDSEDETTRHTKKAAPGKEDAAGLAFQKSQTESHDPDKRWPILDLEHIPHIKSSLDIKAPSPRSDSSNSSDSEDETSYIEKQEKGKMHMSRPPITVSQTKSHDLQTRWPAIDLEHTVSIKRRLDIKTPSLAFDSSSSSDSEDETTRHTKKSRPGKEDAAGLAFQKSQTEGHDADKGWPTLDLEHIPHIKSRLDIKAPSPRPDSSSSSDSEDETTRHTKKAVPGKEDAAGLAFQKSQTEGHDADKGWPTLDLEHIPHIKSRLDIKAPSPRPDSSSSSDSEDETTRHTKKAVPGKEDAAGLAFQKSQTESHDPDTRWPILDLEYIPHIKSRLDIKAPSPRPDSSSSSGSEDETSYIKKQEQGKTHMSRPPITVSQTKSHDLQTRWPAIDLEHSVSIKRRLDIKTPSLAFDSSSSSDSEDETTHHTEGPGKVDTAGLLFQKSQTEGHDADKGWPTLDLEHIPHIKSRLDIKAPSPRPDSSSSSDSEDETTRHTKKAVPGKEDAAGLAFQKSQTESHDPDTRWPILDLEYIPHIKSRLDIKAPSPRPDSSSSSGSEDETSYIKKQEQGKTHMSRPPITVSQTKSHDLQTRWPAIDLEHSVSIKRRLDIKTPSLAFDSSSSSDSEDETTHRTEGPGKVDTAGLLFQKSQTEGHDADKGWPTLDLEHIPHIKSRLDIKAPSPRPDSSSSSDSEDETMRHTKKAAPGKEDAAGLAFQKSQTESHDPDTRWPILDLEYIPHIKSRLDIKAPSPHPDSSSSSGSEDETSYIKKQEQGKTHMSRPPITVSQTKSHDLQTRWPAIDLEHSVSIKRRLDIKTPSLAFDSSSSSDSEDETTHRTEGPGKVDTAGLLFQKSQTESHDPDTRWPILDLEHIPRIKRRLDIKAPSPPPDSSSNNETAEDKIAKAKNHELWRENISRLPSQESQVETHDPETGWRALDVEHATSIKRRLDIKAPLPASDSSSGSDSEDETTNHIKKQGHAETGMVRPPITISQTGIHDQETLWPVLVLEHTTRIKRRLDIKAPSPVSESSSSSDSEDETIHHTKKERPVVVGIAEVPFQNSQTHITHDPDKRWPALDLEHIPHIKRRLDIKAPSPPPDSSSFSETAEVKIVKKHEHIGEHISRLPVQQPQASDSCSSSNSEDETTHQTKMERPGVGKVAELPFQESQTVSCNLEKQWPTVDLGNSTRIKRRLDIKTPSPPQNSPHGSLLIGGSTTSTVEGRREEAIKMNLSYSSSSSDEQENSMEDLRNPTSTVEQDPDSRWPLLGLDSAPHVKRRLDIKAPPAESSSSSSSSSDDESRFSGQTVKHERDTDDVGVTNHEQQLHKWSLGVPHIHRHLDIKAPSPQPDPVLSSVSPGSRQSKSNSSTSDSESESRGSTKLGLGLSAKSKATEEEFIRSSKTLGIKIPPILKTDHNITLEKYTLITDDMVDKTTSDNICTTPKINPELESRWATMNLGISRFRKRLEITSHQHKPPRVPSSSPPDSPSSSRNESGTGYKSSRTRPKRKEVEMTEEKSNSHTMLTGLGTPHFTRNPDIKVSEKAPAAPSQQQWSDSSSSSENEDASTEHEGKRWRGRYQVLSVTDKETSQNHTSLYETQAVKLDHSQDARVEFKSQAKGGDESDSVSPHLSHSNIPCIRSDLDIRAPLEKEASSSSDNSDNNTIDHSVPDLSHGVPRIKRRLNVKAQLPEPSNSPSSCSESENEVTGYTANQTKHASNMTGMTNDSPITYKRLIIKTSFPPSDSSPPSGQTIDHLKQRDKVDDGQSNPSPYYSVGDRNASLVPSRVPSMSFDDIAKKRIQQSRHTSDVDLPREIRWTGFKSLQQVSPSDSELSSPYSSKSPSTKSSDGIKQDRGKEDVTLLYKYSTFSANSMSPVSSTATDMLDISSGSINEIFRAPFEDRRGRRGLSALKAISSERQMWDTQNDNVDNGGSLLFDNPGPQVDSSFNYQKSDDIKPLAQEPLTQLHLSSSSVDEKRATGLLYGIPHYRSHDFGSTEPPQEAPPPIPATPPPDEAIGLTWRSPQSSKKQGLEGTRSYQQQSRKTEESDPSSLMSQKLAVFFDSSNINISEV